MIFGAILAGGTGSRMGLTNMPKQFLELGDKPIIIHTLQKFLLNLKFDVIYLGVHENWTGYMEDLIEKYIVDEENKNRIKIISGGADRNSTIMNIVEDIEKNYILTNEDIIVTHDAVRPFITSRILEENIEISLKYGACDTVIPAIDTIVVSENNEIIKEIPNRQYMYQGQTPQSFKILELKNLYNELSKEEKEILTDACKIFVIKGKEVHLVRGEISNLKITTQEDYKIAQAMIGVKLND
ncbi:IspD/TarI family cytidylyltransferase [Fusobacterium mortiferum]|uniref:Ribitol-5-phosphate cytidylyltransferase n=1 Tax=Fusobacterium mortiferum ATCC 9817 TaxID=469616 RepID=A0ABM6TZL2_FUSMR|nr:2-C-methyl-D-erythritol 4-phosphate cytidylyltransferase [Fusobacterium mortiferum]AVQ19849.1 2-C-methyl-D-erythritol 4-phosphate cytidylyltransferase [Fusobacterium mortiferum ATCC 9817]EEO35713.1 putative 2-C-methyl-D-erythritol 4-phosphate cytidylyltransferase [Fusobacterium mortiferum ATCC 9817]